MKHAWNYAYIDVREGKTPSAIYEDVRLRRMSAVPGTKRLLREKRCLFTLGFPGIRCFLLTEGSVYYEGVTIRWGGGADCAHL